MNNTDTDPLIHLSGGDRWLAGIFLALILPVIGASIIFVQKQPASGIVGWVLKWCVIEFLTVSFVFMFLLFLWAIFKAKCLANPLVAAKRRLTRWLVSLAIFTVVGNIIAWFVVGLLGIG